MNRIIHFALYFIIVIGLSSDVLSRGGSRGSSFSSSRRSSSFSSSRKSSSSFSKPSSSSRKVNKSSTIKKNTTSTSSKPKAVASSKISNKKAKAIASKNKTAAKKYGTKANAEKAYREKLISSNHYNNPTPPSTRPASVPQSITVNHTSINTSYGMLPGGYYGYGYIDPVTHLMVALAANQMMVNDAMMMEAGYGQWDNTGRPIVVHSHGFLIGISSLILVIIIGVIILRTL
jgi:hypothetical protein